MCVCIICMHVIQLDKYVVFLLCCFILVFFKDSKRCLTTLFPSVLQGLAHCPAQGLGSSGPVLSIAGSDLEVDVEYTFRLTVSKKGMPSESTVQKVSLAVTYAPNAKML